VLHGDRGDATITVELAVSVAEQQRGLMWRNRLDADAGMLFVFPDEQERSFWMKNTAIPLDIVFIGSDRRIVSIAKATRPYSEQTIPSRGPSRYVLEVNAGVCDRFGVRAGQPVGLPEDLPGGAR
jgi:uncharacterized membrane protein (UPF0127 family)